jgi:hypothetical protein
MLLRAKASVHEPQDDGRTYPSLTAGRKYVVVASLPEDVHVVNDRGEPIVAPVALFDVIDESVPANWIRQNGPPEDDWYWCGPPEFAVRGFFERWHDDSPAERDVFARVYSALWNAYAQQLSGESMVLAR